MPNAEAADRRATRHELIALAAVCLLGHAVGVEAQPVQSDTDVYHTLATNIVQGNPYSRDHSPPFAPEFQRPFAYPAFVATVYAIAGPIPYAVYYLQALLGALVVPLMWWLARRVAPSNRTAVALSVAALTALNPALIASGGFLLREAVHALVATATVCLAVHSWNRPNLWRWAAAGALIGVGAQIRTEFVVLAGAVPLVVLYDAVRHRRPRIAAGRIALATMVPATLLVAPWFLYLYTTFGTWQLGVEGAAGPINSVAGIYRAADSSTAFGRMALGSGVDPAVEREQELPWVLLRAYARKHDKSLFEAAAALGPTAREYLWQNPFRWLWRTATNALNVSMGYSELASFVGRDRQEAFVRLRYVGLYRAGDYFTLATFLFARAGMGILVLMGAALATIYWVVRPQAGLLMPALLLSVVVPVAIIGLYASRVRIPYDPLLVCTAVVGWSLAYDWAAKRWRERGKGRQETSA